MMSFKRFALASCLLAQFFQCQGSSSINKEFSATEAGIEKLMSSAEVIRGIEENDYSNFLSKYSVQFQGCHHIQQWNDEVDGDEDVRLMTKRLVRFRLVPFDMCYEYPAWAKYGDTLSEKFGSFKNYGEYIVDLNTFVDAYIVSSREENEIRCQQYEEVCDNSCKFDNDNSYYNCIQNCFKSKGLSDCNYGANVEVEFDAYDYAQCAAFDWENDDDAGLEYYYGPYCASQGSEIKFSLFTDDTCTTFASCNKAKGAACYTQQTGTVLPNSKESIISNNCFSCSENYANLEKSLISDGKSSIDFSDYNYGYPRDYCSILYGYSGKCEMYFDDGSENSSCAYIEGVKVMTEQGVPTSRNVKRSLTADFTIGALTVAIAFSAAYVYYLNHLLVTPREYDQ